MSERLKNAQPAAMAAEGSDPTAGLSLILLEASNEFRSLTREFPDNTEYQFRLAQCLRHRLVHADSRGESNVARETFLEAVQILDQLATKFPNEPKYLFELADTLMQASRAQLDIDAKESLDRAVAKAKQLADRFPSASEYQLLLGTALARRAAAQAIGGASSDAEESLKQSISILKPQAEQFPDQGVIQIPLAKSCQQLGDLLRMTAESDNTQLQRLERSRSELQDAIDRFEQYLSKSQANSAHQRKGHFNTLTRSSLYSSLAETLTRLQLPEQAEQARKKAVHERRPGPQSR